MNKKIVFFDGDGTLWYPRSTGRTLKPWWIYEDPRFRNSYLDHLILDPDALEVLTGLRKANCKIVVLSTVPKAISRPHKILKAKIEKLGMRCLLDGFHATKEYPEAKGLKIIELLKKYNLRKSDALMVGDSYRWDYKSAVKTGIDAVLINCPYHEESIPEDVVCADALSEIRF